MIECDVGLRVGGVDGLCFEALANELAAGPNPGEELRRWRVSQRDGKGG